jgi:hypothetical protein
VGEHFETWNAGILGPVTLDGLNEGRRDLTWQKWTYQVSSVIVMTLNLVCCAEDMNVNSSVLVQVGLKGETLSLHSLTGSSSVEWGEPMQKQPLTWYKVLKKFINSIAFHVEKHYFSKRSFIYLFCAGFLQCT